MSGLLAAAPFFLLFEVAQLVVSERYIGVRQIRAGTDPRDVPMPAWLAPVWLALIAVYGAWMVVLTLVWLPVPPVQVWGWWAATLVGWRLRRSLGMNWTLVVFTFEGAVRIGMLASLLAT